MRFVSEKGSKRQDGFYKFIGIFLVVQEKFDKKTDRHTKHKTMNKNNLSPVSQKKDSVAIWVRYKPSEFSNTKAGFTSYNLPYHLIV